jgi:fumarylacetoacetate (FAA) hydrolase
MKLVSYIKDEREQLGVLINEMIYDMETLHPDLPHSMGMFLNYWEESYPGRGTVAPGRNKNQ